jgi:hypothetical protein
MDPTRTRQLVYMFFIKVITVFWDDATQTSTSKPTFMIKFVSKFTVKVKGKVVPVLN